MDVYDLQYENILYLCFSCGRIGHSDLICLKSGTRDAKGVWPFGQGLRALDDRKKAYSGEISCREQSVPQNNKANTKNSSTEVECGTEVTSPLKNQNQNKRKGY